MSIAAFPAAASPSALRYAPAVFAEAPMPDATARATLLDGTAWCRRFTWHQVESLASYMGLWRCEAGEVLVEEDEAETFLGIVARGRLEVTKRGIAGEAALGSLGPGASFGEMALVEGLPRSATVTAVEDSLVLVLRLPQLRRLERDHPRLASAFYKKVAGNLSAQLRHSSGWLVDHIEAR